MLATLKKNLPRDDGDGKAVPTNSESDFQSIAIEDGTIFHRDDLFTVMEADMDAAEAEEAWMEKRELVFTEATTDPLAQMVIGYPRPSIPATYCRRHMSGITTDDQGTNKTRTG